MVSHRIVNAHDAALKLMEQHLGLSDCAKAHRNLLGQAYQDVYHMARLDRCQDLVCLQHAYNAAEFMRIKLSQLAESCKFLEDAVVCSVAHCLTARRYALDQSEELRMTLYQKVTEWEQENANPMG